MNAEYKSFLLSLFEVFPKSLITFKSQELDWLASAQAIYSDGDENNKYRQFALLKKEEEINGILLHARLCTYEQH